MSQKRNHVERSRRAEGASALRSASPLVLEPPPPLWRPEIDCTPGGVFMGRGTYIDVALPCRAAGGGGGGLARVRGGGGGHYVILRTRAPFRARSSFTFTTPEPGRDRDTGPGDGTHSARAHRTRLEAIRADLMVWEWPHDAFGRWQVRAWLTYACCGVCLVKFIGDRGRVLNCQVSLTRLHNSNFGLWGGPWLGSMGPAATTTVPWVFKYPCCHRMITQTHPRRDRRGLEKVGF